MEETVTKIFDIFVERSHGLFSDDSVLMWLREIIGYALNQIDAGALADPDILAA